MPKVFISQDLDTRQVIIDSARHQVEARGIIGLRLADVARGANVSIPLISRYFGSRDGLLAAVLGDWYDGFAQMYRSMVESWLESSESLTLEEFALLSPKPRSADFKKAREFRLQVLAAAIENLELRARIVKTSTESYHWISDVIRRGKDKLPEADRNFDDRIFTLLLFNTMFVFTDLVPDSAPDDATYADFLAGLIRASSLHGR
jgi:AcrR family transcriptional regulator